MAETANESGIVTIPSALPVAETVERIKQLLQRKAIKLFATVDHSGEAAQAGLAMPDTKLLVFGNPRAGTPLMLAAPSIAIDLPLKILVWEDQNGKVWISYNSAEFLSKRHNLPADLIQPLAGAAAIANQSAQTA